MMRPARWSRAGLGLLVVLLSFAVLASGEHPALAFTIGPIPVSPGSLAAGVIDGTASVASAAGAGVTAGGGGAALVGFGDAAAVGAAGVGAVAVAPAVLAVGAALAAGGAAYLAWRWIGSDGAAHGQSTSGSTVACGSDSSCVSITSWTWGTGDYNTQQETASGTYTTTALVDPELYVHFPDGTWQFSGQGYDSTAQPGGAWRITWSTQAYAHGAPDGGCLANVANYGFVKWTCRGGGTWAGVQAYYGVGAAARDGTVTTQPAPGAPGTTTTYSGQSTCSDGSTPSATGTAVEPAQPATIVPACPAGATRTGYKATATPQGGTPVVLGSWAAPPDPSWLPECPSSVCQLHLERVKVDGSRLDCATATEGECVGWQTQPLRAPARTVLDVAASKAAASRVTVSVLVPTWPDSSHAECHLGAVEVVASECSVVPIPQPPSGPSGAPPQDGSGSCVPTGLAVFNPLEWVYRPVLCVLRVAFEPDPAKLRAQVSGLSHAVQATAVGQMADTVDRVTSPIRKLGSLRDVRYGPDSSQFARPVPSTADPLSTAGANIGAGYGAGGAALPGGPLDPDTSADCHGPLFSADIPTPFLSGGVFPARWRPFDMCNPVGKWVHDWAIPLVAVLMLLGTLLRCASRVMGAFGFSHPFDHEMGEEAAVHL